ncbi:MAG: hypothetical protein SynsKO_23560 [Synoicihabitans sp.]
MSDSAPPESPFKSDGQHGLILAIGLGTALVIWVLYGLRFYGEVIPFYDSVAYQSGYRDIAEKTADLSLFASLKYVWLQVGNNVVLYKFFAAVFGDSIPSPIIGLYLYLFTFHALATVALSLAVRQVTRSWFLAHMAVAGWLATAPFAMLRDGVGDQRMDLASGSAYLLVAATGMAWVHRPRIGLAGLVGTFTALAALHRPTLSVSLAVVGAILAGAMIMRHRPSAKILILNLVAAVVPFLLLSLPWMFTHREGLYHYYFEYAPSVGNSESLTAAFAFNFSRLGQWIGWPAGIILLIGFLGTAIRRKVDLIHFLTVSLIGSTPLALLVLSKSTGNVFVQQMVLGLPALLLVSIRRQTPVSQREGRQWPLAGALVLILVVASLSPRLNAHLNEERLGARAEVVNVIEQVKAHVSAGSLAGFHDLPVSIPSIANIARSLEVPFTRGTVGYFPSHFGLSNDQSDDTGSPELLAGINAILQKVKANDEVLLLPTAETQFRLWAGLFSHRQLSLIRQAVTEDRNFEHVVVAGPVNSVMFDVYRVHKNAP